MRRISVHAEPYRLLIDLMLKIDIDLGAFGIEDLSEDSEDVGVGLLVWPAIPAHSPSLVDVSLRPAVITECPVVALGTYKGPLGF